MQRLRSYVSALSTFSALAALDACGGDSPGGSPSVQLVDTAGRHCSVPYSGIEPPTCDVPPSTTCAAGSTACFQEGELNIAAQYKPAAICLACCTTSSASFRAADCAAIECSTDDDCPLGHGTCRDGACYIE